MRPMIIANWKMNQNLELIRTFLKELESEMSTFSGSAYIAPQFIHIPMLLDFTHKNEAVGKRVVVGAQNTSHVEKGAYTGEVSSGALKDMGVNFVIIGHSERRSLFQESQQALTAKVLMAIRNGLRVIYCVGETADERQKGHFQEVISLQLDSLLSNLSSDEARMLVVAYEPVWAIGTGVTADTETITEAHGFLAAKLAPKAPGIPILYGGSVTPNNLGGILKIPHVNGALVGGASLKATDYSALCRIANPTVQ